jgi:uncharacterized protein YjbI with pentapeptide repeats
MIEPALAPVPPHVISPLTRESVRLDEIVVERLESMREGAILILGGPGSGKTTALQHLAAVLADHEGVVLLDEPTERQLAEVALQQVAIAADRDSPFPAINLPLVPWTRDDVIAYLLAVHPQQCKSVMQRLSMTDSLLMDGTPLLWRMVLDRMVQDPGLESAEAALREYWSEAFAQPKIRTAVSEYSLAMLLKRPQPRGRDYGWLKRKCDPQLLGLLRLENLRVQFAAEQVVEDLRNRQRLDIMENVWPFQLVKAVAAMLESDRPATQRLRSILQSRNPEDHAGQSMAASILVKVSPGWRPDSRCHINSLAGAYLDRVAWPAVDLRGRWLNSVDFTEADLTKAILDDASLKCARLTHARLTDAHLNQVQADAADFSGAMLRDALARNACFALAKFHGADLNGCDLSSSILHEADLSHACLQNANLSGVKLQRAIFNETDLSHANLQHADLPHADLRTAMLCGADFNTAFLNSARLDDVDWPQARLENANLTNADLSGSQIPGGNLRGAALVNAKLGEVDWEAVDLRDATLTGATLHMGSTREGLLSSPYASEGTRTGYYTDDYDEQYFKSPEEIRKANLRGADVRGAKLDDVDFYLVDLRGVRCDRRQWEHFRRCGAILDEE